MINSPTITNKIAISILNSNQSIQHYKKFKEVPKFLSNKEIMTPTH